MALAVNRASEDPDVALLDQVYRQALRTSIKEAAESLQTLLTRQVAAYVVGVKDVKTISRWAKGEVTNIRPDYEKRLRTAYEIMTLLLRFEAPETVRAWFIGMVPQLDDGSPARAIHEGRLEDAIYAARSFAANGF